MNTEWNCLHPTNQGCGSGIRLTRSRPKCNRIQIWADMLKKNSYLSFFWTFCWQKLMKTSKYFCILANFFLWSVKIKYIGIKIPDTSIFQYCIQFQIRNRAKNPEMASPLLRQMYRITSSKVYQLKTDCIRTWRRQFWKFLNLEKNRIKVKLESVSKLLVKNPYLSTK